MSIFIILLFKILFKKKMTSTSGISYTCMYIYLILQVAWCTVGGQDEATQWCKCQALAVHAWRGPSQGADTMEIPYLQGKGKPAGT